METLEKSIQIKPDRAGAYNNLGATYIRSGMYRAIETFKRVFQINPDFAESHYNLGVIYTFMRCIIK